MKANNEINRLQQFILPIHDVNYLHLSVLLGYDFLKIDP